MNKIMKSENAKHHIPKLLACLIYKRDNLGVMSYKVGDKSWSHISEFLLLSLLWITDIVW